MLSNARSVLEVVAARYRLSVKEPLPFLREQLVLSATVSRQRTRRLLLSCSSDSSISHLRPLPSCSAPFLLPSSPIPSSHLHVAHDRIHHATNRDTSSSATSVSGMLEGHRFPSGQRRLALSSSVVTMFPHGTNFVSQPIDDFFITR